jgi:hypothetical protein
LEKITGGASPSCDFYQDCQNNRDDWARIATLPAIPDATNLWNVFCDVMTDTAKSVWVYGMEGDTAEWESILLGDSSQGFFRILEAGLINDPSKQDSETFYIVVTFKYSLHLPSITEDKPVGSPEPMEEDD